MADLSVKLSVRELRDLAERFDQLKEPAAKAALMRKLGETAQTLVVEGFAESRAPDGTKWKELKFRDGQPLSDTGRLRNSFAIASALQSTAGSFTIGTNVEFAGVHQFGMTIHWKGEKQMAFPDRRGGGMAFARKVVIPARPMIPTGALPNAWAEQLGQDASDFIEGLLKR